MKIAGCYIRVSTDEQLEFSPDAQLRDIKDYCKRKNIILLENHIYIDEGISGKKADKRPAFQKMIAIAKTKPKPFDVILIHKFDRFARNREDSIVYKSLLRKRLKIDVISIKEDVGTDKNGFLLEGMLDVLAEYYSLNLSDEVKKGQLEKVRKGGNVNKLPFGYKPDGNGGIKIVEEEAKIIRLIFKKFNEGQGRVSIGKELYRNLGIKNKNGDPFSQERIDYILNNPVYAGYIRRSTNGQFKKKWHDEKILIEKGVHEAIIDKKTWDKTQETIKLRKTLYFKKGKNFNEKHWLSGLLRCGNCNSLMIRYVSRGYFLWQCSAYTHGKDLISNSINTTKLEMSILNQLKKDFSENINININKVISKKDEFSIQILYDKLEKNKFQMERIKLAFENGVDTIEEYKQNKNRLSNEKKHILKQLNLLEKNNQDEDIKKIKKICKNAYEILTDENSSITEKYDIAHLLLDKVIYQKSTETITIYYKKPSA